jgi:hypothetical protein
MSALLSISLQEKALPPENYRTWCQQIKLLQHHHEALVSKLVVSMIPGLAYSVSWFPPNQLVALTTRVAVYIYNSKQHNKFVDQIVT